MSGSVLSYEAILTRSSHRKRKLTQSMSAIVCSVLAMPIRTNLVDKSKTETSSRPSEVLFPLATVLVSEVDSAFPDDPPFVSRPLREARCYEAPPPPSTRGVRPCSSSFDVPSYLIAQPQPHSKRPRNARGEYDYRPPLTATTVSRGRIPDIDLHSQRLPQIQHLNHHLTIRPTHKSHSRSSSRSSVHVTSQDIEDLLDAATDERSVLNARPLYQPCELRTIKSILPLLLPAPSKRRANQAPAHNGSPLTPPNNIVTPIAPVPPPAIRLTTSSPTNAIGQRICLQCGLPGRYKDNKCVEKWGPGPEGPGTVCDRCRNKMKRVERRGTTDANVALATPVKLDCTVRKSFLSVRLLGRRDRRNRKSFRARYLAWLLCFYRTTNTVVGLQRTLREIGTVTLSPRLRSLLVFCQTKATAEAMVKASATRFYHSELPDEETKKALDSFRAGAGSFRVLYTTSALSAGLDIRDIRVVVHLRKPNNMLDYGQEFGLGCRDGKPGWTFIFHDPKHKPFTSRTGQDHTGVSEITSWLSTPVCRRLGLSLFFDDRASSCLEMLTVQLCDICQMTAAKALSMLSQHSRSPDAYIAEYL
ncbi:hypothetical protein F4604DRAFT_1930456 [Suillus subluteus]|nr:hypothetical protein F4604DRAFT_1930456 [Suillus subluteus]